MSAAALSLLKPTTVLPLATLGLLYSQWSTIKVAIKTQLPLVTDGISTTLLVAISAALVIQAFWSQLRAPLAFAWNCFLKPISSKTGLQSERLDSFYGGQADLYDATRGGLLKGRRTMLALVASHLREQGTLERKDKKKIWVDIGGGTGWNIEQMAEVIPIDSFDAIYLIDLCEPLLEVARKRFAAKGWKNVHCLRQDASQFTLPEWSAGMDPRESITLATLSYSLSMIPSFYPLLDRIHSVLDIQRGMVGVADFYTAADGGSSHERAIGSARRKVNWLSRWFWQIWFDLDHVNLGSSRRDYLEHKFGTIKSYNGRNNFIVPYLIQLPYYIYLGCSRHRSIKEFQKAFDIDAGNTVGLSHGLRTPATPLDPMPISSDDVPDLDLGPASHVGSYFRSVGAVEKGPGGVPQVVVDIGAPPSAFHYQLKKPIRVPYMEEKVHSQFRTHIYGFTWEDPMEDMKHLNLTKDDSMLVITSAGDNALHYAIAGGPKRIHCVDMNPCQGHILELKLAAVQALTYDEFYSMFGRGKIDRFRYLLDTKLAPYLSSHAYAYWRINDSYFANNFHMKGYSGHALRLAQWAFWVMGITEDVKRFTEAGNVWEQDKIWREKVRPVLMNTWLIKILGSPVFLWNALGVPINQMDCFLKDGSVLDFLEATFDPVPKLAPMKTGAYHYLLCLTGQYTPQSCPLYLTRAGFDKLKQDNFAAIDSFRLHTSTIIDVLRGLPDASLTATIVMDSMDWFTPFPASTPLPAPNTTALDELDTTPEAAYEHLKNELDFQILEMRRTTKLGGNVWFRSAGKRPWYLQRFELAGFKVEAVGIRENGKAIDRVNMYASFYKATRLA